MVPTIRKYSAREGPAPWILFLTPAGRPLQVTVSMLVKLNIAICSHLQRHMHFQQKNACIAIWMRVDTCFYNLFLMSDPCKFRIIIMIAPFPKKTSWFATFQVMWRTIPPQTIMGYFFSWGLMYVYALVNSSPMEIIFLLPDICTRKENNFEICCTIFS